jgi:hypothetical protein
MEEEFEVLAKQAAKIAESVPEKFQEKCFEILFQLFISGKVSSPVEQREVKNEAVPPSPSPAEYLVPIDVRAFLQQHTVPEEKLSKMFLLQGNDVRSTYKITTHKKAKAQLQISLLTALENALKGGKFDFDVEVVRQKCKEYRCYDADHFTETFKNNSSLFKTLTDKEHLELSADGKAELAEVILEMAK